MYGFNQETQLNERATFAPGVNANVELANVTYESPRKDGEGDKCLIFEFRGPNGEKHRHLEWPVGDRATDPAKSAESLSKRVKHIVTKFIKEEEAILTGNTFEEFCNGVINLLKGQTVGKKVAIKLLYDKKDNLSFTRYIGFIAKNPHDLSISTAESPFLKKQNAAPTTTDVLEEGVAEVTTGTDDLPF
jgi:hypothetical protein